MKRKMGWAALMILSLLPGLAKADDTPMEAEAPIALTSPSAILCEASTGRVVFEKNADERRPVASVNKVMTILLTLEALDEGRVSVQDQVTVSPRAASMGGSQAFLDAGERYPLGELLKTVIVASANDSAVAIAEHLAGAEEAFVKLMNARADELGLQNTHYVNCTGLPASGHLTSAHDIALMSRELILNHPRIRDYTTIWMDSLRDGQFQLANTNKLIRFYEGATGLKTGFTDAAGYCMSATAERDGMELIAVILKSSTRDIRNEAAKSLLSYGFANYTLMDVYPGQALPPIDVLLGEREQVQPVLAQSSRILVDKSQVNAVTTQVSLCEDVEAPVEAGQKLGEMAVSIGGEPLQTIPIVAGEAVERITIPGIFSRLLRNLFMAG